MLLDNIALFLTIVEKGSLTAAGHETGLSRTTVSERLSALEAHYGVVLLNRTTRSISLTDAGQALVEGARELLQGVEDLEARIRFDAEALSGAIRVTAPSDLGRTVVSDALHDFMAAHPAVTIDLELSDGFVDIVGRGIDLAVRYGEVPENTLRARGLGECVRVLCAAPGYLAERGSPTCPADLAQHNCLVMRFGQNIVNRWTFDDGGGAVIVTVRGDRVANDSGLVREWCLAGYGIARRAELDVRADIAAGRLVVLMHEHVMPTVPLRLIFPPNRSQPRRVTALATHLADVIRSRVDEQPPNASRG